ncbi:hypothetical protein L0Y65_03230 [Candidatus Micrarchaeota archaeon]|nr:hypothetical protein [Candidatus Micrarchaeota archaeon]
MSILSTPGAAFEQALAAGRSRKTTLIQNKLAGRVLHDGREGMPRIWTGTVVAFPAPGAPFGDTTTYLDRISRLRYILDTRRIKGERGAALVLEAGTYGLACINGERIYQPAAPPLILPAFPQSGGWFDEDQATGLPVLGMRGKLFLWRTMEEAILPVARDWGASGWAKRDIFLNQRPSSRLHAVFLADVEAAAQPAVC